MSQTPDDLRYPIGRFQFPEQVSEDDHARWKQLIADTPAQLREAVAGLSAQQLDTTYRPEGWRLRQVVHHIPDSHMNAFIRFKLTLTEDTPIVKPYLEDAWAKLPDSNIEIEPSLELLTALHARWLVVLESLSASDLQRTYQHPETGKTYSLEHSLAIYAWHGPHHIAQITATRKRHGW